MYSYGTVKFTRSTRTVSSFSQASPYFPSIGWLSPAYFLLVADHVELLMSQEMAMYWEIYCCLLA